MIVFLTAVAIVLFSTLTGCDGCSRQDEVVRWIPASCDTIPEVETEDSLYMNEPVIEIEKVAVNVVPSTVKRKPSLSGQKKASLREAYFRTYYDQTTAVHSWTEEFDLDSIKLTIVLCDLEMQIIQDLN